MKKKLLQYTNVCWQLFRSDLVVFRQFIVEDLINLFTWFSSFLIVFAYVYPELGMFKEFGEFMVFSLIAAESYWRIWPSCFELINDLNGDKVINYYFTLPAPFWLVFVKTILFHIFKSIIFCCFTLSLGIVILWNKINWSNFSTIKFILIFLTISLFTGCFFIFLSSFAKNIKNVRKIGIRIILPLWFFGSGEFPWKTIYSNLSPKLAYILLANPLTYAMEGIHSATLGNTQFLPFWLCLTTLLLFSGFFGIIGILKLKKRLDTL